MKDGEIPTFDNCDPNDPEEMFLPAFVALPGLRGAPLLMPISYYRGVSQRIYDVGGRRVAPPTIKWRPPVEGRFGGMTAQGMWVPIDTPDTAADEAAMAVSQMSAGLRARVREEIERMDGGGR